MMTFKKTDITIINYEKKDDISSKQLIGICPSIWV